jgi:O-antigen ligase
MVFFTCLYACCQFILNNFYQINIDDFLYWPSQEVSNAMALGLYFRVKGFFAEPGHFAFFLEVMIPLIFWNLFANYNGTHPKNIFVFLIIITSFILTMSAAGWAFLTFGLIMSVICNMNLVLRVFWRYRYRVLSLITIVTLLLLFLSSYLPLYDMIIGNSLDKLDSDSASDRLSRWVAFKIVFSQMTFFDFLIGYGPNAMVNLDYPSWLTIILLYPLLFIELGLLGLALFLLIFVFVFIKSLKIGGSLRFFLQAGLFAALAHYTMISNYWYPYLWFLGVMVFYFAENHATDTCVQVQKKSLKGTTKFYLS